MVKFSWFVLDCQRFRPKNPTCQAPPWAQANRDNWWPLSSLRTHSSGTAVLWVSAGLNFLLVETVAILSQCPPLWWSVDLFQMPPDLLCYLSCPQREGMILTAPVPQKEAGTCSYVAPPVGISSHSSFERRLHFRIWSLYTCSLFFFFLSCGTLTMYEASFLLR